MATTREAQLEAKVKELEGKLSQATHALGHAVQRLGGELRVPKHAPDSHPTEVTHTTSGTDEVVTTKP
jgi:hypothetical protein